MRLRILPIGWAAVAWTVMLAAMWGGGAWSITRPLPQWSAITIGSRLIAMATVLVIITLASYFPILLLLNFLTSERHRAEENTVTAVSHQGWATQFQQEVREWYARVFTNERYPIPVTLTIVAFVMGWTFIFFHDGPSFVGNLATDWKLQSLLLAVVSGPAVSFAFLGAYFFSVWFLFKRYISGDLGPGVFVHISMRTWAVVLLAIVLSTVWKAVPLAKSTEGISDTLLIAVAFLGGWTLTGLLDLLTAVARRGLGATFRNPGNEVSLASLQGINPWKAARLIEEGVDNVQNLAMEDPTKLVVVTQESGLRILDWIDQAILLNAAGNEDTYQRFLRQGIRTAYDLYLAFRVRSLLNENAESRGVTKTYIVEAPPDDAMAHGMDKEAARNILLSIVHHPNFEKVKQMREQAVKTAEQLFRALVREPVTEVATVERPRPRRMVAPTAPQGPPDELSRRGVLTAHSPTVGGVVAMATLVGPDKALTILDLPERVQFLDSQHQGTTLAAENMIRGILSKSDPAFRLALYRLERSLDHPKKLAHEDPELGSQVISYSYYSGRVSGTISGLSASVKLGTSEGEVIVKDMFMINVTSRPGDGGAPILNDAGDLVGIVVAGSANITMAVPVSVIRRFISERD